MTLEEYIADLNSVAFWREFTFAQNRFSPRPGKELELADSLVWSGDRAYVLQLKQREHPTGDPDAERSWFEKKVLRKATSQIRDSLRYLRENARIHVTNMHGHGFEIEYAKLATITKIVVFLPGPDLPEDCLRTRYHASRSTGEFIHVIAAHDYLGILRTLRVPEDIARYFAYREAVAPRLRGSAADVAEADIMGAFLAEEDTPSPVSHTLLGRLVQDLDAFDLSEFFAEFHKRIEQSDDPYDYYRIMREFARLPRSVWREAKLRLMKAIEITGERRFSAPFRMSFSDSDCAFMIAPLPPELPATGPEGEKLRVTGLCNLTRVAKHLAKTSKCVGTLVSRDGEFVQIDWCVIEGMWRENPDLDAQLADESPFRAVREEFVDGFIFEAPK